MAGPGPHHPTWEGAPGPGVLALSGPCASAAQASSPHRAEQGPGLGLSEQPQQLYPCLAVQMPWEEGEAGLLSPQASLLQKDLSLCVHRVIVQPQGSS